MTKKGHYVGMTEGLFSFYPKIAMLLYIIWYKVRKFGLMLIKTCDFFCFSLKKVVEKFGGFGKSSYLCTR